MIITLNYTVPINAYLVYSVQQIGVFSLLSIIIPLLKIEVRMIELRFPEF